MANKSFFEEATEASQAKSQIVSKYFWAWAKIILSHSPKIQYIDLFAGPGRYINNATKSTPLLVLEKAIGDEKMRDALIAVFNDRDPEYSASLKECIHALPGIETLRYKPQILNFEIGADIVHRLEKATLIPTLCFIDPWGYKGLSLRLINAVLKDWACECIFFFNYNRINMGLNNEFVIQHMEALFGEGSIPELQKRLERLSPDEREPEIVEALSQALKYMGGKFVLPFRFRNPDGTRTSHHLIFVTKHILGYEIMKEIMAQKSSDAPEGVPSFEYNQATQRQPLLFELSRPLEELKEHLLGTFYGRTLTMLEIYGQHHVGTRYIKTNYKRCLAELEAEGKIQANPSGNKRRKQKGEITFGDKVLVTFSEKAR